LVDANGNWELRLDIAGNPPIDEQWKICCAFIPAAITPADRFGGI
jgi:hypothetical protein